METKSYVKVGFLIPEIVAVGGGDKILGESRVFYQELLEQNDSKSECESPTKRDGGYTDVMGNLVWWTTLSHFLVLSVGYQLLDVVKGLNSLPQFLFQVEKSNRNSVTKNFVTFQLVDLDTSAVCS